MPIPPAVVGVLIPAVLLIHTVHGRYVTCLIKLTAIVTFITNRSLSAVSVPLIVAATVDDVVDQQFPLLKWAGEVVAFAFVAMPIFAAVKRIREVAVSKLCAVCIMSTV